MYTQVVLYVYYRPFWDCTSDCYREVNWQYSDHYTQVSLCVQYKHATTKVATIIVSLHTFGLKLLLFVLCLVYEEDVIT